SSKRQTRMTESFRLRAVLPERGIIGRRGVRFQARSAAPWTPVNMLDSPNVHTVGCWRPSPEPTMRTTWSFHTAGKLIVGRHAVRHLTEVAVELRIKRLLLVTDPNLLRAGLVEHVHGPLSEAGVTVELFSGGEPEPSLDAAYSALAVGREFHPDAVLGL